MNPEAETFRPSGPVTLPVTVHDSRQWLGRAMYYDVLALSILLLSSLALGLDIYQAGYLRAAGVPASPGADFGPLVQFAVQLALFIASFAWIAARLVRAGYREIPRVR